MFNSAPQRFITKFEHFLERLVYIETKISIFMLGLVVLVVGFEVFCRYVLNRPKPWTYDVSILAHIIAICVGYAAIYTKKGDIYMKFVYDRLSNNKKLVADIIAELSTFLFIILFISFSVILVWEQFDKNIGGLGIPYFCFYTPIIIAGLLILPVNVLDLLKIVERAKTIKSEERKS